MLNWRCLPVRGDRIDLNPLFHTEEIVVSANSSKGPCSIGGLIWATDVGF